MKITSVEIHPDGSSFYCVLSFRDPTRQNPYNVKSILGLDADEIVPRYYGVSGSSNTNFYNLVLESRDLVFQIELNPDFSEEEDYSSLRDNLMRAISSSRTSLTQVQFKNGSEVVAAISGFVQKFETEHFSKTQEVKMTIHCEDPTLRALEPVDVNVAGLDPALFTVQDPLSTQPHGVVFDIEFTDDLSSFSIGSLDLGFTVMPNTGFLTGDVLHISSEYNNRQLYLTRDTEVIHLADVIFPGSFWPLMFPGDNDFICLDAESLVLNSISYYPTYWGV